jgi:hypothetical protein
MIWIWRQLPDFAGQSQQRRFAVRQDFSVKGMHAMLMVVLAFVLVFGMASLLSIYCTALLIDRYVRA